MLPDSVKLIFQKVDFLIGEKMINQSTLKSPTEMTDAGEKAEGIRIQNAESRLGRHSHFFTHLLECLEF